MWFKNLLLYRLTQPWTITADALEERLAKTRLQRCGSFEMESRGWVAPRRDGVHVYTSSGQMLMELGFEQKLLPASVVRDTALERAVEIEAQQGYPVGRKQMRDLKEQVLGELLPKAFSRRRTTRMWLAPELGWLVIDAASEAKGDEVMQSFGRALDDVPAKRLGTQVSPASCMTKWLASGEAPHGFSIDRDLELQSAEFDKPTIRYVRHALEGREIQQHIASGKTATRLGMTWQDRVSFVLTDTLQVKRLDFLGIEQNEGESQPEDEEEKFENDFVLMTGELTHMLQDLIEVLGGAKSDEAT